MAADEEPVAGFVTVMLAVATLPVARVLSARGEVRATFLATLRGSAENGAFVPAIHHDLLLELAGNRPGLR